MNPSNPGKMVDFISQPALLRTYADQFAPYDVDWSKPFQGTLFRLPLRDAGLSEVSRLSKRVLSEEDARAVLASLVEEANSMLLFLKSVARISVRVWEHGATTSDHVFTCHIANINRDLVGLRQMVAKIPSSGADDAAGAITAGIGEPTAADFVLEIECTHGTNASYVETWAVCNQFGGTKADRIARSQANALLKLVPYGGVAACIGSTSAAGSAPNADGVAYCFLPLPIRTGLPVMV